MGAQSFKLMEGGILGGWMDGWPVDRWMDGWIKINRLMKGGMNGWIDRWMGGKWTGGIAWMDD